MSESSADERLPGSLAAALWAWSRGVHVLRVHDVAETRQAIAVWNGIADGVGAMPKSAQTLEHTGARS